MIDNVTGLRCKVADVTSLVMAMKQLYEQSDCRKLMGEAGRNRVLESFTGKTIVKAWCDYYNALLLPE